MKRWLIVLPLAVIVTAAWPQAQSKAPGGDAWLKRPVDDQTFRGYLDFFKYDTRLPLDVQSRRTED